MKLNIRGEKHSITDSMKSYAEEKLHKLDKYLDNSEKVTANAVFKLNGPKQKIEITIPLNNYTLRVEETGQDFYEVLDISIDKLERQIRKNKTRLDKHKNKEKNDFIDFEFETSEENNNKIVKRKSIELKPMDEEEAIVQMELLNHDFYVFKNTDSNKISIIYKRKDENYGLIEED